MGRNHKPPREMQKLVFMCNRENKVVSIGMKGLAVFYSEKIKNELELEINYS